MSRVSDRYLRYREFFQRLVDRLRKDGYTNAREALSRSYYGFSVGYGKQVLVQAAFRKGGYVAVGLYIDSGDKDWNKALFDRLQQRKESIETGLGESAEWLRMDQCKACRIHFTRQGTIDDVPAVLDELEDWMFEWLMNFRRVFGPHLNELVE